MKVFRSAPQAGRWAPAAVIALGKFDGLHLGHQKVIKLAVGRAKALATKCLVVTFDPVPQDFFHPGTFKPILSQEQTLLLLDRMGVDGVLFLPFNRKLACQVPEAFAQDILAEALKVVEVCVGADFCFGKDRAGRVDGLENFGRQWHFLVRSVPLLRINGERVSSSLIRRLIDEGRRQEAERYLGRKLEPSA